MMVKCAWCSLSFRLTEVDGSCINPVTILAVKTKERLHFCGLSCLTFWSGSKAGLLVTTLQSLQVFGKLVHKGGR